MGEGDLHVVFCAEFDALPDVGHACGHNIIAASSLGAAIGLGAVADELNLTVTLLGTPSEEGGGGKIDLINAGYFDDVHAAMMVHPFPTDRLDGSVSRSTTST
jgi:metal-dependent amidase/aminoacylase/carboxypeptidase family protein